MTPEAPELTILHISDLHFGPPYVPRVGEALLREAALVRADVIVASGDFTQRAKPEQFAAARKFLDSLPAAPVVVVPGNHDVPLYRIFERLFDPYRYYRQYIAEDLDQVVDFGPARFVALNSAAPRTAITNGAIRPSQLEFCEQAFADHPLDGIRIVVAHHHFAPAPDYDKSQSMRGARRALDTFHRLDVEMVMGGHQHRAYVGNSLDVYPGADRERGIIIAQSGTSTSRRGRAREHEKNTFNVIHISATTIFITHYMYFTDLDGFASISRHEFPRSKHRFLEQLMPEPAPSVPTRA
ncbi:MAG: metallophosphoesterase [Planctomycetales bacterium]|nr:metallophosphoesterase [Planctomycetales bacterium]